MRKLLAVLLLVPIMSWAIGIKDRKSSAVSPSMAVGGCIKTDTSTPGSVFSANCDEDGNSVVVRSSLTVRGNAFSVGGSTIIVANGRVSIGADTVNTSPFMIQPNVMTIQSAGVYSMLGLINPGSGRGSAIHYSDNATYNMVAGTEGDGDFLWMNRYPGLAASNVLMKIDIAGAGVLICDDCAAATDASAQLDVQGHASGRASFIVDTSTLVVKEGNVGIGVTNPSAQLQLTGSFRMAIKSKAELGAITPVIGDAYLCSDCTITYAVCVGTAATLSGFRQTHSATLGCGTGE